MDDGVGNPCASGVDKACDSSGNGNVATWTGGVASTSGKFGYATNYDGVNDYVDAGTINLGNATTLSAWVKIPSRVSDIQTIFANGQSGSGSDGFKLFINTFGTTDQKIYLETGNGTNG